MKNRHTPPERRIDLKAARRILGKAGKSYSDEQLQDIIDRLYGIAEWFIGSK